MKKIKGVVGLLGSGEIGSAIGRICKESGFKVLVRELKYDELKGENIDYFHISIPEKDNNKFIEIAVKNIKEFKPELTIINSSVTPGTTRKISKLTGLPIVHSPVIGVHPYLYESIKKHFPKIIGPVDKKSGELAKRHLKSLGLKIKMYTTSEDSEAAKLLDLVYYAWNIIFCKWMKEVCDKKGLNFDEVYIQQNQIYNEGYKKLRPNVIRPILKPLKGPIGGHCTIPDTIIFDKYLKSRFTKLILEEDKRYEKELA